jgi:hypothetical protein
MNTFFNALNDLTTDLFMIFKELKHNYNTHVLKRTRLTFSMVLDMYRILEVMTLQAGEIFVDKSQIHSIRLMNYIMFVLHSVFVGSMDHSIEFFASKVHQRSDTLAQFLAPLLGILCHLYLAVNTQKDRQKYDDLADIFAKTDSFDPVLFQKMRQVVISELPPKD